MTVLQLKICIFNLFISITSPLFHLVQMPEGFIILYLFSPGTLLLSVCVLLRSRSMDSRLRFHFQMNFIIYSNTYTRNNYPFNFYNYVGICTINEAIKIFLNNLLYNIYILKITCTHNNILCTLIHLIYLWTLLRAFILYRIFCFMIIQTYIMMLFMIKFHELGYFS